MIFIVVLLPFDQFQQVPGGIERTVAFAALHTQLGQHFTHEDLVGIKRIKILFGQHFVQFLVLVRTKDIGKIGLHYTRRYPVLFQHH